MLSYKILILCGCKPWGIIVDTLNSLPVLNAETVIQYSAILAGFISITMPIALSIVSRQTEVYKDSDISGYFLKNWRYRFQLYGVLTVVFFSIILFALDIKSNILNWAIVCLDLISMVAFVLFMRLVQKYAIDVEEYLANKFKSDSDDIVS